MTAPTTGLRRGSRWSPGARRELGWLVLFLSPWIIGAIVFTFGPMLWSLWLSFTNYDPLSGKQAFIGLANYEAMTRDHRFTTALTNTAFVTALFVPASLALGIALATMLDRV